MKRWLRIQTEAIDEAALLREREYSPGMGAVVSFLGVVRGAEGASKILALEYEAFLPMAQHQFEKLFSVMEQRWPVESVRLVHRIGAVSVKEASLWVEIVAPHRAEAFAACQWLIDEMKKSVPIWKKPVEE